MTTASELETAELARRALQQRLDLARPASLRNRLGQFATPPGLALQMAQLARRYLGLRDSVRFLDPAIGTGVFYSAALSVFGDQRIERAVGYELDAEVAEAARRLWGPFGLEVEPSDFCRAAPPQHDCQRFNLLLCNPPYVRHHHLSAPAKATLRENARQLGLRVSGLAGLYCYFLLLAHRWLADGGLGVWIVPAEFLDVNYGRAVKRYLTTQVRLLRVHRFRPEQVQFGDALVTSAVLVVKKTPPIPLNRVRFHRGQDLVRSSTHRSTAVSELDPAAKWGPLFESPGVAPRDVLATLTVGDLFRVRRGLATGANRFFILPRDRAVSLGLPSQYLRPILPSPRHIAGSVIESTTDGFPRDLPQLVLLDCDLSPAVIDSQHPRLARYLDSGQAQGISVRYLPRSRSPWYRQEQRPAAPILCTYMGRDRGGRRIRFLLNRSAATASNVYLMLYPRPRLAAALAHVPDGLGLVFLALSEAAAGLSAAGRIYGGGLNKIEPKELEVVPLPPWLRDRLRLASSRPMSQQELFL